MYGIFYRFLTKKERVISGLSTGHDAPLIVREGGIAGRVFFAEAAISKGSWLCEYKASKIYPPSENQHMRRCMRSIMKDATLWNLLIPFLMWGSYAGMQQDVTTKLEDT